MKVIQKRILAIDMGNHSYKMIEAVRKPNIRILRYSLCSPEEINGIGFLTKEMRKLQYLTKDAILSFHHKSMVIRELKLPEKYDFPFQQYIQEEILRYETDFKEEYDYVYLILPERNSTGQNIAATAAVSRSVNREYIDRALRLGLKLKAIDVQINASLRVLHCLMDRCKELSPSSSYLMLDLGYDNTTVAIAYLGRVFAPKVIPVGCRCLEEESADPADYLLPIIRGCGKLIDTFTYSYADIPLRQGFVYGGGSYCRDILSDIQSHIALNLSDMHSFQAYFPEIPSEMDLNLYVNCFGSLLRKDETE